MFLLTIYLLSMIMENGPLRKLTVQLAPYFKSPFQKKGTIPKEGQSYFMSLKKIARSMFELMPAILMIQTSM